MSDLHLALADYLNLRRSLGYKLQRQEKLLNQFINFFLDTGAPTLTTQHALTWACQPQNACNNWWSYRLSAVRGFANYLHTTDPTVEVPPLDLLPWRARRATPYLYPEDEIVELINAAGTLRSPQRAVTYQALIGLLTVTGMRVGEAIRSAGEDGRSPSGGSIATDATSGRSRPAFARKTGSR